LKRQEQGAEDVKIVWPEGMFYFNPRVMSMVWERGFGFAMYAIEIVCGALENTFPQKRTHNRLASLDILLARTEVR
jgi:hypothetical protein